MHVRLSVSYVITFLLLLIVMMELHEIVHISVGKAICGCWGPRDFNVWSLCDGCKESKSLWWLATLMGPLFSFAVMWWGMIWLKETSLQKKALGFSLIFSNFPLGRITTVMMGGGDEMVVIKNFLKDDFSRIQMILTGSAIVLALGLPPIVAAYRSLGNKHPWLYIIGFLTLPLVFLLIYTLQGLNALLENGFMASVWLMGTPVLITVHTCIAFVLLLVLWKNLLSLNQIRPDAI